jgi:hypothetical protein
MKPREIFGLLREIVEPPLLEMRFSQFKDPAPGTYLVWTRPLKGRRYETVAFQIDKWPWDPWLGTRFIVLMTRSRRRGNVALCKEFATMFELLTEEEKREIQEQQNKVIARCRVPGEAEYNAHMGFPAYSEFMMRDYREACLPVDYSRPPNAGLWLRITDAEDTKAWGQYLAAWIPRVLARDAETDWGKFGWGG